MTNMFNSCTAFNQSVASFDTSKVTNMDYMFVNCSAFDQSVANFNTGLVESMILMFYNNALFNRSLASFNVANATSMSEMIRFSPSFSTANYDATLISWAAQAVKSNVPFHAYTTKYSAGAATVARGILTSAPNNWTISDGGQV
jgi:surface protein